MIHTFQDVFLNLGRPNNAEKLLYFLLAYLQPRRRVRVMYLLFMVAFVSLYSLGREFFHIEKLTGKYSIINQMFVKMGWGWTLAFFVLLRTCCLPLHSDWVNHLWKLLLRVFITTLFFYLWCQVIFPEVEQWTGYFVKKGIVVASEIPKDNCLRSENHEFYSFDISGHSFLLSYCIFVLMEESMELVYIFNLRKILIDSVSKEECENKLKVTYLIQDVERLENLFKNLFPIILVSSILVFILCIIWDYMLIVTTIYYHTFSEKIIGTSLAVGTWFLLYQKCFTALNIL